VFVEATEPLLENRHIELSMQYAANFMLYGELGRYPLNITVKLKILSFCSKLIDGKQSKLSSLIYRLLHLKTHGNNTFHGLILLNQFLMTVVIQTFGILKIL
jgi:hypothetical protein